MFLRWWPLVAGDRPDEEGNLTLWGFTVPRVCMCTHVHTFAHTCVPLPHSAVLQQEAQQKHPGVRGRLGSPSSPAISSMPAEQLSLQEASSLQEDVAQLPGETLLQPPLTSSTRKHACGADCVRGIGTHQWVWLT